MVQFDANMMEKFKEEDQFGDLTFEEHVEILKQELDIDPAVLKSTEAKLFISKFGNPKTYNGGFDPETNTVAVKDPNRIGTLAHEMRHAWQYKNKDKNIFNFLNSKTNLIAYPFSKKEWDANKYARRYCKNIGLTKMANEYSRSLILNGMLALLLILLLLVIMAGITVLIYFGLLQ